MIEASGATCVGISGIELSETTIPTGGTVPLEISMVDSTFIIPGGFELSEEGSYGGSDESY